MNKLPELPEFSRDLEIVQALQRFEGMDVAALPVQEDEERPDDTESVGEPS